MKKYAAIFALFLLLLAGCEKQEQELAPQGFIPAETIFEAASEELKNLIQDDPYENIDFSGVYLSLTDEIGDIYDLEIAALPDSIYSQSEAVEIFERYVKATFSYSENVNEKNYYRFLVPSGGNPNSYFREDGVLVHPGIYQANYLEKIKSEEIEIESLLFQTDTDKVHSADEYFWWFPNGSFVKMNRGDCMRKIEKERRIAGWMPRDDYSVTGVYSLPDKTVFTLEDGKATIDDAAAFCEDYFANTALYTKDTSANLKVHKVNVLKIDNDIDAFLFFLTPSHNGIPFDSLNREGAVSAFSDGNEYLFNSSEALMTKSYEVEYCYLNGLNNSLTPVGDRINSVVPLKKAAEIVSEELSDNITFEANSISLVYCNKRAEEKGAPSIASANWRFELYNPNDNMHYMVYVNAANGNSFYYRY